MILGPESSPQSVLVKMNKIMCITERIRFTNDCKLNNNFMLKAIGCTNSPEYIFIREKIMSYSMAMDGVQFMFSSNAKHNGTKVVF